MNDRQQTILAAVVQEYTKTGLPVGSQVIAQKYVSDVSSATIRNDMTALEDEEFLHQPHISSGRIPTDKGYRYFVESAMEDRELSVKEQRELQKELLQLKAKNVRMARTTAKLLSALSGNVAVSGSVDKDEFYEFGLRKLLEDTESNKNLDDACRLAEALEYIDERVDSLLLEMKDGETKIFIGEENPIQEISGYSMVVSPYKSKDGDRGMIALIGPKRMEYAKNKSLIEYVKKFLGGVGVIFIVVSL